MPLPATDPRSRRRSAFGTDRQYQHRQYQPRHRTGLRLVDAGQQRAVQRVICNNAKAASLTIYTVQVNTGGDATSAVLQYCASGTDKFYLVTDPNRTLSVFNSIGQSPAKLRVAK